MILFFAIPQHRLNGHSAVHQADAGVGGVAVYAGIFKRGILVAAELQDGVVHLGAIEYTSNRNTYSDTTLHFVILAVPVLTTLLSASNRDKHLQTVFLESFNASAIS